MQATAALMSCGGNAERAGDWLFSHMDDLDAAVASVQGAASPAPLAGARPSQFLHLHMLK